MNSKRKIVHIKTGNNKIVSTDLRNTEPWLMIRYLEQEKKITAKTRQKLLLRAIITQIYYDYIGYLHVNNQTIDLIHIYWKYSYKIINKKNLPIKKWSRKQAIHELKYLKKLLNNGKLSIIKY
jgi:hypothetical protein